MISIEKGARIIVEQWLLAKPDDVIHFITDETKIREAEAITQAVHNCGAVPKVTILPSNEVQSGDCIEEMREIMSYATSVVGATNYSFITTDAVHFAITHGAKFLSLPLSTNDGSSLLENDFITMNPKISKMRSYPMLFKMNRAKKIRVTTDLGTDISFGIEGRKAGLFNGVTPRGQVSSASFEVYVAPEETKTNGKVVLDGSMGYIGCVKEPFVVEFKDGYVSHIQDTPDGRKLRDFFEGFHDSEMYCAAEFGIGLNEVSKCIGRSYIEDESTYGTFHIGMGRNLALGGKHDAEGHFDIVTHSPTIWTDAGYIEKKGIVVKSLFR